MTIKYQILLFIYVVNLITPIFFKKMNKTWSLLSFYIGQDIVFWNPWLPLFWSEVGAEGCFCADPDSVGRDHRRQGRPGGTWCPSGQTRASGRPGAAQTGTGASWSSPPENAENVKLLANNVIKWKRSRSTTRWCFFDVNFNRLFFDLEFAGPIIMTGLTQSLTFDIRSL